MKGIRVGTIVPVESLKYCRDDNTYEDVYIDRPAFACPIEWAPRKEPEYNESLWDMLFS